MYITIVTIYVLFAAITLINFVQGYSLILPQASDECRSTICNMAASLAVVIVLFIPIGVLKNYSGEQLSMALAWYILGLIYAFRVTHLNEKAMAKERKRVPVPNLR